MMNINPVAFPAAESPRPASVRTVGATAAVSPVSAATDTPARAADPRALQDAVAAANEAFQSLRSELNFSIDDDTGKTVVRVVEKQTGTLIRQIPSPEMLEIAKALDRVQGLLVKSSA